MEMPVYISLSLFPYSHSLVGRLNGPYVEQCCSHSRLNIHTNLTYHLTAWFTFNSRLFFCTVKSMRATTLPESASAVVLISSVHHSPSLCNPTGHQSAAQHMMLVCKSPH